MWGLWCLGSVWSGWSWVSWVRFRRKDLDDVVVGRKSTVLLFARVWSSGVGGWRLDVGLWMWSAPAPASLTMGCFCQAWRLNNDSAFLR